MSNLEYLIQELYNLIDSNISNSDTRYEMYDLLDEIEYLKKQE